MPIEKSFAKRLALIHPMALSVAWLGLTVALQTTTLTAMNGGLSPIVPTTLNFLTMLLTAAWMWAVWTICTARTKLDYGQTGPTVWTFFAMPPLFAMLTFAHYSPVAKWVGPNSPGAILAFGVFLYALWRTAEAVEQADVRGAPATTGRILGTCVQLFFLVIGFWTLRQRLVRVAG